VVNGFEKQPPIAARIRWMIRGDMEEVLDIERACFEFPWFEEDFIRALRERNCIGMVADEHRPGCSIAGGHYECTCHWRSVVGYMIYELHKTRLHVLNFAVDPVCHRRGVGRSMVQKLTGKLSTQRRTFIDAKVRESNVGAQLFFRSQGFKVVEVLRDHYEASPEDAYLMQYRHEADVAQGAPT
jgi:ribosomal-protein-alanine N-acetyltransferase